MLLNKTPSSSQVVWGAHIIHRPFTSIAPLYDSHPTFWYVNRLIKLINVLYTGSDDKVPLPSDNSPISRLIMHRI